MTASKNTAEHPAEHWKGRGGQAWVSLQEVTDGMFQAIEKLLVDEVEKTQASSVLDIGCGAGRTTLAIAESMGSGGVSGIDVSEIMIDTAKNHGRERGLAAEFICADAQIYPFPPESYDLLVSRFGVMFFPDPVAAFANLRRAASKEARCVFTAWRSSEENPFMVTAGKAAQQLISLPKPDPAAPGQFAFAEVRRVEDIFFRAGWKDLAIEPLNFECQFPAAKLEDYFIRLGPLSSIFHTLEKNTQTQLITLLNEAFAPYVFGDTVKFTAACWQINAST